MTDSNRDIIEFQADPRPLQRPLLITAFKDHGGQTAAAIVEYLIDAWDADELAVIDPDAFYDFAANRPHARLEGDRRVIDWPTLRLHRARPAPLGRDLLFFHGPEPSFQWQALAEAVTTACTDLGVHDLLSISTFPGATPHTREIPLWMMASDPALAEPFDVDVIDPPHQGPLGFRGVLNTRLRAAGLTTVSLVGVTPFYLGLGVNPPAGITLLETLARAWQVELDLGAAHREAHTFLGNVGGRVARSERLQEVVARLETQYDQNRTDSAGSRFPAAGPLPPTDELLADVEQFLRNIRTADDSRS